MQLQVASVLLALVLSAGAAAQQVREKVVQAEPVEAVVVVTAVDRASRAVTVRGPKGNERTLLVPPEAQNLDQVKPGSRFKVQYLEEVAVALSKGGEGGGAAGGTGVLWARGGTPGGGAARTG
jgi:hypothetical protein